MAPYFLKSYKIGSMYKKIQKMLTPPVHCNYGVH